MIDDTLPTTIDPDECVDGLVFVTYFDGVEQLVQRVRVGVAEAAGVFAAEQANAARSDGRECAVQIFDGDSGRRLLQIRVGTPPEEWAWSL